MPQRIAVILAGGKSSRMGADKATAMFRGERLIDRVARLLALQADRVLVSGPSAYGLTLEAIPDDLCAPDGPVGGVFSAARRLSQQQGVRAFLTAPVDAPFLPEDLMARLVGDECRVASDPESVHPTFAYWTLDRLAAMSAALRAEKSISLFRLAELAGARRIEWADHRLFANINTEADRRRFESAEF
ncbi:MAG: molybdenum cofactor guanylyltransferase [Parvularculaceae bacterium]|nr:molybdenum cofactor guanylyltransferase [Parvularculaceae bacterium]